MEIKVHRHAYKSSSMGPIISQLNPLHMFI